MPQISPVSWKTPPFQSGEFTSIQF
jgi:hypothetical protein